MGRKLEINEDPNETQVGIKIDANLLRIIINNFTESERIRLGAWNPSQVTVPTTHLGILLKNNAGKDAVSIFSRTTNTIPTSVLTGGNIWLNNKDGKNTISLDGDKGDITLQNADCAEEFDIFATEPSVEPGTVMVIGNDGRLQICSKQYDKRVAGVVSGAGSLRPGIVLGNKKSEKPRVCLAMLGRVFCKVDASQTPIKVGDLLTTSNTRGYAMKASNRSRAFGAVIGKALKKVNSKNLIPVLIALQ